MCPVNWIEVSISVFTISIQSLWLHQNMKINFFPHSCFSLPKPFVHFCELCTLWSNHKLHLAYTMFTGRGTLYLLISFRLLLIAWLISPQVLISLMLLQENACSSCWLLQPAPAKCSEPYVADSSAHGEERAIWEFSPLLLQLCQIFLEEYM